MERRGGGAHDTFLTFTGLTAVTLASGVSAYRAAAARDVASLAFVGASYAALLLLFRSLRAYERLPPPAAGGAADADDDGRRRRRRAKVKREVWALCTLLTVLFSWKVAAAMPSSWPIAAAVWAMAVVTAAGGFLVLFRRHP